MNTGQYLNRNALKLMLIGMVITAIGMAFTVVGFKFADSPAFCGSCHSMEQAHATWQVSNHKQLACTECHLPNRNLVEKMIVKSQTGMHDTYHEILRDYPASIKLSTKGKEIVVDNCLRCHQSTVENTKMMTGGDDCTKCHRGLVHGIDKNKGGMKVE